MDGVENVGVAYITAKGISQLQSHSADQIAKSMPCGQDRKAPRATEIRYCPKARKWQVHLVTAERINMGSDGSLILVRKLTPVAFSSPLRSECVEWEKENFEEWRQAWDV